MNKVLDGLGTQIFVDSINGHGLNDVYIRIFVAILFLIAIDKKESKYSSVGSSL